MQIMENKEKPLYSGIKVKLEGDLIEVRSHIDNTLICTLSKLEVQKLLSDLLKF